MIIVEVNRCKIQILLVFSVKNAAEVTKCVDFSSFLYEKRNLTSKKKSFYSHRVSVATYLSYIVTH